MHRQRSGFTLTEMLVTISMVGILAAVSTASLQPLLQKQRLAQAAQQVEQAIRKTQQTAITRAQQIYIEFDNNSYTLGSGNPCTVPRSILATESLPAQIQVNLAVPGGSTLNTGGCLPALKPLVLFDFQGMARMNDAGKFVRLNSSSLTGVNYDVYILSILGDVGTAKP
jgi:type II secretion system protein H